MKEKDSERIVVIGNKLLKDFFHFLVQDWIDKDESALNSEIIKTLKSMKDSDVIKIKNGSVGGMMVVIKTASNAPHVRTIYHGTGEDKVLLEIGVSDSYYPTPPSEEFKMSRKIGKFVSELSVGTEEIMSDSSKSRFVGVALEKINIGDIVSVCDRRTEEGAIVFEVFPVKFGVLPSKKEKIKAIPKKMFML